MSKLIQCCYTFANYWKPSLLLHRKVYLSGIGSLSGDYLCLDNITSQYEYPTSSGDRLSHPEPNGFNKLYILMPNRIDREKVKRQHRVLIEATTSFFKYYENARIVC